MRRAVVLFSVLSLASRAYATSSTNSVPPESKWMLALEGGYGPRFEQTSVPENPQQGFSSHHVAHAGTIGLSLSRFLGYDAYLVASARAPLIVRGEYTVGLGAGWEKRVTRGIRLGGVATFGFGGFTANACDCGRLRYSGFFVRADLTFRYRFLEGSVQEPRSAFDFFFSAAIGGTVMQSHYPHTEQNDASLEDTGIRIGPHATLGVGFEF